MISGSLLAGLLVILSSCSLCSRKKERPDIIFITLDTQRADHLGCYGYFRDTSPAIDDFAKDGILFQHAYTTMATTVPAHASLFTSTIPLKHRVWSNRYSLDSDAVKPFAAMLRRLGYTTAAFVSAAVLKEHTGLNYGFDVYDVPESRERRAEKTNKMFINWLSKNDSRPLFLWLHYFDPHNSYRPPGRYKKMYSVDEGIRNHLKNMKVPNFSRWLCRMNNRYDGEISYMDSRIAELFRVLKEKNLYNDSVIVMAGDHGEGMGQHYWLDHGLIYNEMIEVPLIIKLPQSMGHSGEVSGKLASVIDILPTVQSAVGLHLTQKEKSQFEGIDLLDDDSERQRLLIQRVRRKRGWEPGDKYALVEKEWKFMHAPEWRDELYNISTDHAESRNLVDERPEEAGRMKARLLKWIAEYSRYASSDKAVNKLDPVINEQLKALGYLEDEEGMVDGGNGEELEEKVGLPSSYGDVVLEEEPEIRFRSDAMMDGKLVYLGMDMEKKIASAGERIKLTHYFRVIDPQPGWKIFVEFRWGKRKSRKQMHIPANGKYPMHMWKPGQIIRDTHSIRVPKRLKQKTAEICVGLTRAKMRMKIQGEPGDKSCVSAATLKVLR